MLNYQYKAAAKLISLILAQVFLLTGIVYQGSIANKITSSIYIQAKDLRVPMMGDENQDRLREAEAIIASLASNNNFESLKVFNGFERFVNLRKPGDLVERLKGFADIRRDERFRHLIPLLLAEKEALKISDEPSKVNDLFYRYPTNCSPCSARTIRILQRNHFKAKVRTVEFPRDTNPDLGIDMHRFVITEIAGKEFIIDLAADQFEPLGDNKWTDLGVVLLPVEIAEQNPEKFWMYTDRKTPGNSPTKLASNEILPVSGDEGSGQAVVWQPKNILFRTVEGKSVAIVGRLPQATGKEQRIEPKIEYATGKKVLDSSSGLNIAEIEGVNDEFGKPKRFVLKHEVSEAMLKRYPSDYTLRDNGERTVFAMNLLRLLLEEEFKEYDVMLPEILIVEDADSGQRFIATEYIESAKPLKSRLLDRDDSRTMATYKNHELLDVYCGFLLYMDDREFLLKGDVLIPFDLETALAPIYYMKNGQIDHGYNASGYFLRGQVSDYKRIAARIKDFMLDEKGILKADVRKKIAFIIKESGLIDNVREIKLDGNVLEVITADKIVSFLEAQANSIEYSIEQANRIPAVMGFVEQIIPDWVTRTTRTGI